MTLIELINADFELLISVNLRHQRHLRAIIYELDHIGKYSFHAPEVERSANGNHEGGQGSDQ